MSGISRFFTLCRLYLIQFIQRNIVTIKQSWFLSPGTQPDSIRKIAAKRTNLGPARIFRPRHAEALPRALPLVIDVHGGGFMMNAPCVDDPLARYLADNANCIVISIDYSKTPANQFPAAYEDVVETTLAILAEQESLHVDKSKVVLLGISSGGNLVLGSAQDSRLRGKLLGVAAITPVVNLLPSEAEQMATRPDPSVPDFLQGQWDTLLDLYVGSREPQKLRDVRLSPTHFKDRDDLPKHVFMIGAEHDLLRSETVKMAERLAIKPKESTSDGWRAGDVKWMLVQGQPHAFQAFAKRDTKDEQARLQAVATMNEIIAQWLNDIFSRG